MKYTPNHSFSMSPLSRSASFLLCIITLTLLSKHAHAQPSALSSNSQRAPIFTPYDYAGIRPLSPTANAPDQVVSAEHPIALQFPVDMNQRQHLFTLRYNEVTWNTVLTAVNGVRLLLCLRGGCSFV